MNGSRNGSWARFLPAVALAVLAGAATCWAGSLTTGVVTFSTSDQSMWQAGVTNGITYQLFNVSNQSNPFDTNYSVNNEQNTQICFFSSCFNTGTYGYAVNANLSGYIGATASLTLSAGAVSAQVPVDVSLGFPSSAAAGSAFNITSSGTFEAGASLNTYAPGVNLTASVYGALSGGVSAQACVVACTGTVGPTFSTTNYPAQNSVTVLNADLGPGKTFNVTNPADGANLGSLQVGTPLVSTDSAVTTSSQSVATPLTLASTSATPTEPLDNFLSVNLNATNIAATGLGLPPLQGSIGVGNTSLNYNLLSINLGGGIGSVQNFSLTPTPQVAYNLTFIGDNGQNSNVLSQTMDVGTPYSVTIPNGYSAVEVTPTYSMSSPFVNNTGFSPTLDMNVSGLSVGLGPISTPNLVNKTFTTGVGVPIYLNPFSFDLGGWNSIQGSTFTVDAATVGAPEPRAVLLLAAGLLLLLAGLWSRRRALDRLAGRRG